MIRYLLINCCKKYSHCAAYTDSGGLLMCIYGIHETCERGVLWRVTETVKWKFKELVYKFKTVQGKFFMIMIKDISPSTSGFFKRGWFQK